MLAGVGHCHGNLAAPGWSGAGFGFWGHSACGLGFWLGLCVGPGGLGPGWCVTGVVGGCVHECPALAQGASGAPVVMEASSTGRAVVTSLQEVSALQESTLQLRERYRTGGQ